MINKEFPYVKEMFESIAHRYDFLNRLLSLKHDVIWRSVMVRQICRTVKLDNTAYFGNILDMACGTGDVGLEIIKQYPNATVFEMDFSINMLKICKEKNKNHSDKSLFVLAGDAFNIPFPSNFFDAITIAFGIRNINDRLSVLKESYKSLKPDGKIIILELTMPTSRLFGSIYGLYFKKFLPVIGRLFSKSHYAYNYLPLSVMNFPSQSQFASLMKTAGFHHVQWKPMTFGIVTLFVGEKIIGRKIL